MSLYSSREVTYHDLWRLERIERLLVGKDGHPRAAVVKIFGDGRQATFIQRPIQKLYPVELTEKQIPEDSCSRSRRRATEQADERRRLTAQQFLSSQWVT